MIEDIKTALGEGGYVTPQTPDNCPLNENPITICLNQSGKTKTP